MSKLHFDISNGRVVFSGHLTRTTITRRFETKTIHMIKTGELVLDFSNVEKVDTAGLAWLLTMIEQAKSNNCQLSVEHIPEQLMKVAQLSAVDTFIPLTISSLV
jgi:phospholipid transport system transporter-binding protein